MLYSTTVDFSGIPIKLNLEYEPSLSFFADYQVSDKEPVCEVSVSEQEWADMARLGHPRCAQIETSVLTALISNELLAYDRFILHAVAFSFRGKAWLITANPGVGKSTQIKFLQKLYPGEFEVICGDRPIVRMVGDGTFMVHPSPWNGKENWKGGAAAPLTGILCLTRDDETSLQLLQKREAVLPVFGALISTRETEAQIKKLAELETSLLKNVPIYAYHNGGVPDSTKLLYDFLKGADATNDI